MGVIKIIATVLLVVSCVFLIVVVLLQSSKSYGLSGSIGGGAETFFGKNKAKSFEGKLQLLTKISAAAFMVLCLILAIL